MVLGNEAGDLLGSSPEIRSGNWGLIFMGQSQTHCLKQGLTRNFSTHSRRLGGNSVVVLYLGRGIFSWRVRGVGREIQFWDFNLNLPCAHSVILLTISPIFLKWPMRPCLVWAFRSNSKTIGKGGMST